MRQNGIETEHIRYLNHHNCHLCLILEKASMYNIVRSVCRLMKPTTNTYHDLLYPNTRSHPSHCCHAPCHIAVITVLQAVTSNSISVFDGSWLILKSLCLCVSLLSTKHIVGQFITNKYNVEGKDSHTWPSMYPMEAKTFPFIAFAATSVRVRFDVSWDARGLHMQGCQVENM